MHEVYVLCATAVWEEMAQSTFTLLRADFEYFQGLPAPDESLFLYGIQATSKLPEFPELHPKL